MRIEPKVVFLCAYGCVATVAALWGVAEFPAGCFLMGILFGATVGPRLLDLATSSFVALVVRFDKELQLPPPTRDTAIHEAGHAVVGWFDPRFDGVVKTVSVEMDEKSLGRVIYDYPNRSPSMETWRGRMRMDLGGMAAHELILGTTNAEGAAEDLGHANKIARGLTRWCGANPAVGLMSFSTEEPFSQALLERLEAAERAMLDEEYAATMRIVRKRRALIEQVADVLLTRKTLTGKELEKILGPRPKPPPS